MSVLRAVRKRKKVRKLGSVNVTVQGVRRFGRSDATG